MRWLADECLDARIASWLREAGHDVLLAREIMPGAVDRQTVSRAIAESSIVLTEDKDFGELVVRRGLWVPGLVLLRVGSEDIAVKRARLDAAIQQYGDRLLGNFAVIDGKRIRCRSLKRIDQE